MIDTHCHLTYDGLYERVDQVVARALEAGVDRLITVGTTGADAQKAVDLANRYENVFAAVGFHPHYADQCTDRDLIGRTFTDLIAHDKVVALGEMGLDLHYADPPLDLQIRALRWQLEWARRLAPHLPIIIHNREATDQTLSLLRDSDIPGPRFVFHCFTGCDAQLESILDFGAMVSFTGIVTFKNAAPLAACAAAVPIDRLMIETDSPYLTPHPHRKVHPNEPCYVTHVAHFLAEQRRMKFEDFVQVMDANAQRFFALKPPSDPRR